MANLITATAVAVTLTACSPQEVVDAYRLVGVELTAVEADAISAWTEAQDCLPWLSLDQYRECSYTDAWSRHLRSSGLTIEQWARIGWCESRHDPAAFNAATQAAGVMQHLLRYFGERAARFGYPNDPFNPRASIFVAAALIEEQGTAPWASSESCWR